MVLFSVVAASCFRHVSDAERSYVEGVPEYEVSIPSAWIAPADANGQSWDSLGALPQDKLRQLQRRFREKTKGLFSQQCWWDTNEKWTCTPAVKSTAVLALLLGVVVGLYKQIDAIARDNKVYRPDPVVELYVNGQSVTFPERSNTYAPKWDETRRLRIKIGDFLFVRISDADPFGAKQPITLLRIHFQPSQEAQRSKVIRFVENKDLLVKRFILEFRKIERSVSTP